MMTRGTFGIALALALAVSCSSQTPAGQRSQGAPPDETIAPATIGPSPVSLKLLPERVRGGAIEVRMSLDDDRVSAWGTPHAWLDRESSGTWAAAWLLLEDRALSIDAYRAGGVALTSLGVVAPGTVSLRLEPAPPVGSYRLRVPISSQDPSAPGTTKYSWATATLEIAA